MVYLEPDRLGWDPLFQSWISLVTYLPSKHMDRIRTLVNDVIPPLLCCVKRECRELSPTTEIGLVNSFIRLFDSLLDPFKPLTVEENLADSFTTMKVETKFVFAVTWSIGASLDEASQKTFNQCLRGALRELRDTIQLELPFNDLVYDYVNIHDEVKNEWVPWLETVEQVKIESTAEFNDIIIPTKDTARYNYLMDVMITHNIPLLMVGPTGTGKSKYIAGKLYNGLPKNTYIPLFVNFSARTSANQTQDMIMAKMEKRRKGVYGAPHTKKFVIFVDDLNMPAKETYGAQPPIELLRQWMDHGNWYDRKDTSKIELIGIQFIAAMGPPGGMFLLY
jgi:dynein heavy chain